MKKILYQTPYISVIEEMSEGILARPSDTEQDHDVDSKEHGVVEEEEVAPDTPNLWGDFEEEE